MDLELDGKVAAVTGGNRGIGKVIAAELARNGMDVAILARDRPALESAAKELAERTGRKILPFQTDTSDEDHVSRTVKEIAEAFDRIDVLVNGAARAGGPGGSGSASTISDEEILADFKVKVLGYLHMARQVAPYMKQNGWGRIINLGGMGALSVGNFSTTARNVSVAALTKILANELGPDGIGVVGIHPNNVYTDNFARRFAGVAEQQRLSLDDYARRLGEGNAIKRMVTDQDVANVVAFLASPRAMAISGETIAVTGGSGNTIRY